MLARLSRLFWRPRLPHPPPQAGKGRVGAPVWVEAAELSRWLAGEGAPIVVDVRGPDEFDGPLGHIEGACNIPLGELTAHINVLGSERVMVCLTDKRSSQAATALSDAGIHNVAVLRGGMKAWREGSG